MKSGPEIRCDDVLQTMFMTKAQVRDLNGRTMFECFKRADELFEKYQYPMTLAICAEGLEKEEKWVEHIQKNIHRYNIELHCYAHINSKNFNRASLKKTLRFAIKKIEKTFPGNEITTWYPPWGRRGEHPQGPYICQELGIRQYLQVGKVDAKLWFRNPKGYPHVNFHAWNDGQVNTVNEILEKLHENR